MRFIKTVNIVLLAFAFAYLSGVFLYFEDSKSLKDKNPLFRSLGLSMAGVGGSMIAGTIIRSVTPQNLMKEFSEYKQNKIL